MKKALIEIIGLTALSFLILNIIYIGIMLILSFAFWITPIPSEQTLNVIIIIERIILIVSIYMGVKYYIEEKEGMFT